MAEKKDGLMALMPTKDELMGIGKSAGLAAVGLGLTQLGAALAKHNDKIGAFAAKGAGQEFIVDLGAGVALAVPAVAALGAWKGPQFAKSAGLFIGSGVVLSAAAAPLGRELDKGISKILNMLHPSTPAPTPGGYQLQYGSVAQLPPPGGARVARLGANPAASNRPRTL